MLQEKIKGQVNRKGTKQPLENPGFFQMAVRIPFGSLESAHEKNKSKERAATRLG